MSPKILTCISLAAILAGCSKEPTTTAKNPPQISWPSRRPEPMTSSLFFLLNTSGLKSEDILQVVECITRTNNLVSQGIFPAKIRGGSAHIYGSDDNHAVNSEVIRVALCGSTNAVIEALSNGGSTNFKALKYQLSTAVEHNFTNRILESYTNS